MLLEGPSLRMPGLEIRVSLNPKFEKKNAVLMHIIPQDIVFDHTSSIVAQFGTQNFLRIF